MENPTFLQALRGFLRDRIISPIPLEIEAPQLAEYNQEIDILETQLKNCLSATEQEVLINYSNANTALYTEAIEYAYRKGFKEGVQLITNIQTMD
jgi:hypothetical protein